MDVRYMREFLMGRYPNSDKIRNMKDNQIIAVYYRVINSDQKPKQEKKIKLQPPEKYHQITLEEVIPTKPVEVKNESPKVKAMEFHQITMEEYLKSLQ